MFSLRVLALVGTAAMMGCAESTYGVKGPTSPVRDSLATAPVQLNPDQEQAVADAVRQRTADGGPVTLYDVTAGQFQSGEIIVCGRFNSGAGAKLPFAANSTDGRRFFLQASVNSTTYGICSRRGLPIPRAT